MSQTNLQSYINDLEAKVTSLSMSIAKIEKSITDEIKGFIDEKPQIELAAKNEASKEETSSLNLNLNSNNIEQITESDLQECLNQMYKL